QADAAVVVAAISGPVGLDAVERPAAGLRLLLTLPLRLLRLRRDRRDAAVGRVDDERGDAADVVGALQPVRRRRDGAPDRAEVPLELLGPLERELVLCQRELRVAPLHPLPVLVIVQDRARAERLGPLHRNALEVVAVVDALEIRLAP